MHLNMRFNVKRYFQVLGITLGVIFAVFLGVMGIDFTGGATRMAAQSVISEVEGGRINVLLMCTDEEEDRTDSIVLVSYDTEGKSVQMLSIPRDTRMYIGNRYQKINAAHAFIREGNAEPDGPAGTIEAVNRLTGVPINYYVDFSFEAIADVIDQMGPVVFDVPDIEGNGRGMVYDDPAQDLHINIPAGRQSLDGKNVVHLLRYRHGNGRSPKGYANGDIGRIAMQQEFLRALVDQKLNAALIEKMPSIFSGIKSNIKTNFTITDIIKYSGFLLGFSSDGIHTQTLPGDNMANGSNGAVLVPNMKLLQRQVITMFDAPGDNMWYAAPGAKVDTARGEEYTVGGYKRSNSASVLNRFKPTELTNDELCILNGVEQSDNFAMYGMEPIG